MAFSKLYPYFMTAMGVWVLMFCEQLILMVTCPPISLFFSLCRPLRSIRKVKSWASAVTVVGKRLYRTLRSGLQMTS